MGPVFRTIIFKINILAVKKSKKQIKAVSVVGMSSKATLWIQIPPHPELLGSVVDTDPDPHQTERQEPDPHQSDKLDPDPHQSDMLDPDPHQFFR
jgi:hypothetical protein